MEIKIDLTTNEQKDLKSYCKLNELDETEIVKKSYLEGFKIEKYGLLGNTGGVQEKQVVKEVIVEKRVEIPVEVIKEVVKIEYVEVPVEVIKEVFVEVPVEKEVVKEVVKQVPVEIVVTKTEYISDNTQINELLSKIQQLENTPPKIVEVIKEIPVDRVVIQEKLVEVVVEKEVIVEKPVEVIVEKEVIREVEKTVVDNSKSQMLQETLQKIRGEGIEKDKRIKELEKQIDDIKQMDIQRGAVYLRGSNLNDTLYK